MPKPENENLGLGWRITKGGDYKIDLPPLSPGEEAVVLAVEKDFGAIAREKRIAPSEVERELSAAVSRHAEKEGLMLDSAQKRYIARYAKMHVYGFAFLDELLGNDNIKEISVIGVGKPAYVFIRKRGWQEVNAVFESERALMDVVNKMAGGIGRRITLQQPRLDAMLPGGSRLHASLHPVSSGEITIRKFRQSPFSPREIAELGTVDYRAMAFLSMLMQTDSSVLIAGNTASGKTTTLNALFSFVPRNERIVITEETPEISIPHAQQVRLVANREMGITLKDLVYDSLRMRPDRIIVGEVRNREEAEALFDVLLGGQARGAYATFHAQSAGEALLRLGKFGVAEMDLQSIDAIVVQRRLLVYDTKKRSAAEARRIVEIAEICCGGKRAGSVFAYSKGRWDYSGGALCGKIAEEFGMNAREFGKEMAAREKWLRSASADFREFFAQAQKRFYNFGD
ncbi:Type II/IV secretion system protein [uncultured archaeon]|nr:Type II/IV secretion system protein [uncultured archaeon]